MKKNIKKCWIMTVLTWLIVLWCYEYAKEIGHWSHRPLHTIYWGCVIGIGMLTAGLVGMFLGEVSENK